MTPPSGQTPRVALLGNVANCLLPMAVALRDGGFEADLLIDHDAPAVGRPENADPALADAPWIRRGRWFSRWAPITPWRTRVVGLLRTYDLVIVSGPGPIFAQWSGRPWCWFVSGADLTVTPFPWTFRDAFATWPRRLAAFPLALWQRRAARRADEIWVQPFAPIRDAVARLGLTTPPVSNRYLPLAVDVDELRPDESDPVPRGVESIIERMDAADLVVFHPSRLVMHPSAANVRSGQWKGNDRLLRALGILRAQGRSDGVLLVMPEILISRDVDEAKDLAQELEIEDQLLWARPPSGQAFTRAQMGHLYAHSDVVVDEFGTGWFGFVALEGLAMGIPVVSYVDEAVMAILYPDGHPIQSAFEPGEIADRLIELRDPARRAALGARGRRWVESHHAPSAVRERYVAAVTAALDRHADRP